jgi:hypothetical protein
MSKATTEIQPEGHRVGAIKPIAVTFPDGKKLTGLGQSTLWKLASGDLNNPPNTAGAAVPLATSATTGSMRLNGAQVTETGVKSRPACRVG